MFLPDNSTYIPVSNPNMHPVRTANARLPMAQRLSSLAEVEQTYTEAEALLEASRCLGCPTHWCSKACPAGVPVTEFIAKVRQKDYEGAYQLISTRSALPEFCSRLCPQEKQCQSNCTRAIRTQAVGIGRLERFVTEQHYAAAPEAPRKVQAEQTVAIIGSGPSGLSTAQVLVNLGYGVTVLEANPLPGGLLRYGIPSMKLEDAILNRKIQALEAQGVTFQTNVKIQTPQQAQALLEQYQAVVLCAGTGKARSLPIANLSEVHSGIHYAVEYLSSVQGLGDQENLRTLEGKQVIIVGGGDTGNDCVGVCLRQGCAGIQQIEMLPKTYGRQTILSPLYQRKAEQKFDSSQEECLYRFTYDPHLYQTTVKAVTADSNGTLAAVTIVKLRAAYDAAHRLHMEEIPGSEQTLPCQLLIIAAGFTGPTSDLAQAFAMDTDGRGNFSTQNYQTSIPGLFACGDCRTGQSLVCKAMTDGRACAQAVDAFLQHK